MRWLLRALALVAVPCGIAAFYNVYADEPGLDAAAQRVACGERAPHGSTRMARQARTPFRRSYGFVVGGKPVDVDCVRTLALVGDYACARRRAGP